MAESQSNGIVDLALPEFVTLGELSIEFGMPKSNLRRWALDRGIIWHKRRVVGNCGNALQAALHREEAEILRRLRREAGFRVGNDGDFAKPISSDVGFFYVVAIVPELDPRRLKFGYTANVAARLMDHRVIAPTLQLMRSYPCRSAWERPAIECLGVICRQVGGEVYHADSVEAVITRGEQFFSLMPRLDCVAQEEDDAELS